MKVIQAVFLINLMVLTSNHAEAKKNDVPEILSIADKAYKDKGVDKFISTIFRNNTRVIVSDFSSISNLKSILNNVEDVYGKYYGLEIVEVIILTKTIKIIYFIMKYERGPLYASTHIYKINDNSEKLTSLTFNTELDVIIPNNIIFKY